MIQKIPYSLSIPIEDQLEPYQTRWNQAEGSISLFLRNFRVAEKTHLARNRSNGRFTIRVFVPDGDPSPWNQMGSRQLSSSFCFSLVIEAARVAKSRSTRKRLSNYAA